MVVSLIVNALGQSAIVRLSRSFAAGDTRHFANLLKRMSLVGIGLSGVGLLLASVFGRTVLRLLYGPEYAAHLGLLLILVATSGVIAVASFLSYGMSAARRFREQLPVTIATVTTCATAAFLLTPRWGLTGAAIAILLSGVAQVAGSLIVLAKAVRMVSAKGVPPQPLRQIDAIGSLAVMSGVTNELSGVINE